MYPKNVIDLHIELTDKCQASCPMCARNYNGGIERSFVGNYEISLDQFQKWFPEQWLSSLNHFYACGNYGDPIIAKDCLEIFEYVRSLNPTAKLTIHTNGGARTIEWWTRLAKILGNNHEVTFGIDGFEKSHVLYRRGTNWDKIIENARAFIESGGNASVDFLVFKHNENEVSDFEKFALEMGFKKVNFKSTARFYDMAEFPVENKKREVEYTLQPAESPDFKKVSFIKLDQIKQDFSLWETHVSNTTIVPKCVQKKEIYVDARGNVLPCCWVGSDVVEEPLEVKLTIQHLRNLVVNNSKDKFSKFFPLNLNSLSLEDIITHNAWDSLVESWHSDKPWVCVKNCNGSC